MEVSGRKGATTMADSVSLSSTEDYDVSCQPCSFEGNNVAAEGYCQTCSEYLCKTCLSVHRKQSATRNHAILGRDQMPKVQPKIHDICSKPCTVHPKEIVKFYCKGHGVVGCGDCMVLDHKPCKVDLVSDVSAMTDVENREVRKQIDKFEKELEQTQQLIKSSERDHAENFSRIIQDIKTFREEINTRLDKMEAELVSETKKANQEAEHAILEFSKELQMLETSLRDLTVEIDSNVGKHSDLFVSLKQARAKLNYLKMSHTHLNKRNQMMSFQFERNKDLSKLLSEDTSLGVLKKAQPKAHVPDQQISPPQIQEQIIGTDAVFEEKIEIKDASTIGVPKISGIAVLTDDELIATDNRLQNVRLIDLKGNNINYTLSLESNPFDITCIDKTRVAVTVPAKKLIKFISSKNGILQEHSDVIVNGECYGISRYSDGFVVSFLLPVKVEMLDIDGNVLRSIVSDPSDGQVLFSKPHYIEICQSTKTIFVSDKGKESVIAVTPEGKKTGLFKERIYPRGLFALNDGRVLVADYTGVVRLITSEGNKYKAITGGKDDLIWPLAVCYCYGTKKLYVSNSNGNDIYVYKLS